MHFDKLLKSKQKKICPIVWPLMVLKRKIIECRRLMGRLQNQSPMRCCAGFPLYQTNLNLYNLNNERELLCYPLITDQRPQAGPIGDFQLESRHKKIKLDLLERLLMEEKWS